MAGLARSPRHIARQVVEHGNHRRRSDAGGQEHDRPVAAGVENEVAARRERMNDRRCTCGLPRPMRRRPHWTDAVVVRAIRWWQLSEVGAKGFFWATK